MKERPSPQGLEPPGKKVKRRMTCSKKTPSGIREKEGPEEDAPGLDQRQTDSLEQIVRGGAGRGGHHAQDWNLPGKGAKDEGGATRRRPAASMRRSMRKSKLQAPII